MTPIQRSSARTLLLFFAVGALVWTGCDSGSSSSPSSPTSPGPPTASTGNVTFRVVSPGVDQTMSWGGGSSLAFCRRAAGWADLWIRGAEQSAGNGEASPHLDLDVCNLGGGGAFAQKDPQSTTCTGAQTFDMWWHGSDAVYFNNVVSSTCSLMITKSGTQLTGTFSCRDLREMGGSRTADILDGSFSCTET